MIDQTDNNICILVFYYFLNRRGEKKKWIQFIRKIEESRQMYCGLVVVERVFGHAENQFGGVTVLIEKFASKDAREDRDGDGRAITLRLRGSWFELFRKKREKVKQLQSLLRVHISLTIEWILEIYTCRHYDSGLITVNNGYFCFTPASSIRSFNAVQYYLHRHPIMFDLLLNLAEVARCLRAQQSQDKTTITNFLISVRSLGYKSFYSIKTVNHSSFSN